MRPSQYNSIKATIKPLRKKRCKNPTCRKEFQPQRPLQAVCNFKCGMEWVKILDEKRERKEWNKRKQVLQEKVKSLKEYKKELQPLINKIARLIDFGQSCIATGNSTGKMNGGHYTSVGANDTIRFHLANIHIQSEQSNTYRSGDLLKYQEGIRKAYGQKYLDYMDSLQAHPALHLTKEIISEKIKLCRQIIKRLEKESKTYSPKERIELRNKINLELNIYDKEFCVFILTPTPTN